MTPEVIFSDQNLLILNKPPFWHCLEGKSKTEPIVSLWLQENYPEQTQLSENGICHRLDFQTSGCLMVARNPETHVEFREKFSSRNNTNLKKTYWAIVESEPSENKFKLYFRSRYKGSKKVSVDSSGNESECGVCMIQKVPLPKELKHLDSSLHLLEVDLVGPGKRHQIRAGLSFLGAPILGDTLYGGSSWFRLFGLHARKLEWNGRLIEAPIFWKKPLLSKN